MTFRNLLEEQEYKDYSQAIMLIENGEFLNEGFLDNITKGIKDKIEFFQKIATASKNKIEDIVKLFKDTKVFKFFKVLKFSFEKLFVLIKKGYQGYIKLQKVIASYVASQGAVKWTKAKLKELDEFLQQHPVIKKLSGVVISGLLLYIWLNMSFGGDFAFDMSFDDIIAAAMGQFSLAELFAGDEGVRMLLLFATGTLLGLSFPWPGSTSIQLVSGVLVSLGKVANSKIKFKLKKG